MGTQDNELNDVDELYNSIYNPVNNDEPTPAPEPELFDLGTEKVSRDQLLEYGKQWTSNKDQIESYKPYKEVDEYAKGNPDWWNHVQESYKNKGQQNNVAASPKVDNNSPIDTTALSPELKYLFDKFTGFEEFIQEQKTTKEYAQRSEEDSKLDSEINQIKEQYKTFDFGKKDDKGLSLEARVLQHAEQIGTKSFRVAFRDYNFDKLEGKAIEKGKEAVVKDLEKKNKLGVISESKMTLVDKLSQPSSTKNKSYSDLTNDALKELGIN